jgi:hypothetical protein
MIGAKKKKKHHSIFIIIIGTLSNSGESLSISRPLPKDSGDLVFSYAYGNRNVLSIVSNI